MHEYSQRHLDWLDNDTDISSILLWENCESPVSGHERPLPSGLFGGGMNSSKTLHAMLLVLGAALLAGAVTLDAHAGALNRPQAMGARDITMGGDPDQLA